MARTRVIHGGVTLLAGRRALGLLALALSTPSPAAAQLPDQVSIDWRGPTTCPRSWLLESEVGRLLGPHRTELPAMRIDAKVEELGSEGFELALNVQQAQRSAQRRVRLATCGEVQDAAALLIATAIDPDAALRAVPKPSAEPPPTPPPASPPTPLPPLARWSLLLGAVGDLHSLSGLSAGPMIGGSLSLTQLRLSTQARYLAPRTAKDDDAPDVATRLDLFSGSLGAGFVWPLGPFVLGPAALAEMGFLRARTRSPAGTTDRGKPSGSALLGAAIGYGARARIGLELGVYAGVPLFRTRLLTKDEEVVEIHRGERFLVRAELAVRVSLGPKD